MSRMSAGIFWRVGAILCVGIAFSAMSKAGEQPRAALVNRESPMAPSIPLGLIEPDLPRGRVVTRAQLDLGQRLFSEKRLSQGGHLSCAICHDPEIAFAERRTVSNGIGFRAKRRNSPSLLNVGFMAVLDWDGKAQSL